MKQKSHEKGQALIIIALAAVGLFGFTALAIDGSMVFSDRRNAQNAADTSVLAAALAKIRGQDYEAAGLARALSNGYDNDADSSVEVNLCSDLGVTCVGLPAGADPNEYIKVKIVSTIHTTFARIVGRQTVTSTLDAIARARIGEPGTVGPQAAIAAMDPDDFRALWGNGNFNLSVHNAGIFSNSADPCGFATSGASGSYTLDPNPLYQFQVVGGYCPSGPPTLNPSGALHPNATSQPWDTTFSIPAPSIDCGIQPSVYNPTTKTYSPGNHVNLNIPNGNITFAPGNHCFSGGANISGATNITADNTNFLITSGEFVSNMNGTFKCDNMLIHVNGGTGYRVNGNSTNICNGITFYLSTGDVSWSGNPTIDFKAPGSGVYAGLLIYMPFENHSPLTINGNSNQSLSGSIIAAGSPVAVNGNSGTFALHSQIIGGTVQLSGNGNIEITYDPALLYVANEPTVIQLTE